MTSWWWPLVAAAAAAQAVLVAMPAGRPVQPRTLRRRTRGRTTSQGRPGPDGRRRHAPGERPVEDAAGHARLAEELAALSLAGLDTRSAWSALSADACTSAGATVDAVRSMIAAGGDVAAGLRRCDSPQARWLAVAWQVSASTGAPLANVLDGYAGALRRHVDELRDRRAALAGARATAKVLTVLPALGLGLGVLLGVDPLSALFAGTAGRLCALAGGTAWLTGHLWSAALVRRAERGPAP